jgi:uncharacterized protein (DUF433 family)
MESTVQAISHIVKTPGNLGGKPHIAGRRIGVHDVVIAHLQLGESVQEVATNYTLTMAEIYAALAYYYDHQAEIDSIIERLDEVTETYGPGEEALAAKRAAAEARRKNADTQP